MKKMKIMFEVSIYEDELYYYVVFSSEQLNDIMIEYLKLKQIGYKPKLLKVNENGKVNILKDN